MKGDSAIAPRQINGVHIVRQGKALYIGLSKYPVDKLLYALNYLHDAGDYSM